MAHKLMYTIVEPVRGSTRQICCTMLELFSKDRRMKIGNGKLRQNLEAMF